MPTFRIDWPATLYRLEHVVEVLATCDDLCGFVPDQAEAQRALAYCQRRVAGEPEEEDDNSLIESSSRMASRWTGFCSAIRA
jgi:hypothetical protein